MRGASTSADLQRDEVMSIGAKKARREAEIGPHEFWRPCSTGRADHELASRACMKFATGLWDHQI